MQLHGSSPAMIDYHGKLRDILIPEFPRPSEHAAAITQELAAFSSSLKIDSGGKEKDASGDETLLAARDRDGSLLRNRLDR
jgi:hypothetical protein